MTACERVVCVRSPYSLKSRGGLQFTYYTKLQEKSCYYLLIMYMKKHHRKSKHTEVLKRACAICNVHTYYSECQTTRPKEN